MDQKRELSKIPKSEQRVTTKERDEKLEALLVRNKELQDPFLDQLTCSVIQGVLANPSTGIFSYPPDDIVNAADEIVWAAFERRRPGSRLRQQIALHAPPPDGSMAAPPTGEPEEESRPKPIAHRNLPERF